MQTKAKTRFLGKAKLSLQPCLSHPQLVLIPTWFCLANSRLWHWHHLLALLPFWQLCKLHSWLGSPGFAMLSLPSCSLSTQRQDRTVLQKSLHLTESPGSTFSSSSLYPCPCPCRSPWLQSHCCPLSAQSFLIFLLCLFDSECWFLALGLQPHPPSMPGQLLEARPRPDPWISTAKERNWGTRSSVLLFPLVWTFLLPLSWAHPYSSPHRTEFPWLTYSNGGMRTGFGNSVYPDRSVGSYLAQHSAWGCGLPSTLWYPALLSLGSPSSPPSWSRNQPASQDRERHVQSLQEIIYSAGLIVWFNPCPGASEGESQAEESDHIYIPFIFLHS